MKTALISKICISVGAVAILTLHSLHPNWIPRDAITFGLVVIAVLPWLYAVVEEAGFGGYKVKFRALEVKTDQLQANFEKTRTRIDNLVIRSMSLRTLGNLKKVASGNFGVYYLGTGISRELSFLESLGYVSFKCKGIDDIPQNGHERNLNLSDFVELTSFGKEYLELRDVVEQRLTDQR